MSKTSKGSWNMPVGSAIRGLVLPVACLEPVDIYRLEDGLPIEARSCIYIVRFGSFCVRVRLSRWISKRKRVPELVIPLAIQCWARHRTPIGSTPAQQRTHGSTDWQPAEEVSA